MNDGDENSSRDCIRANAKESSEVVCISLPQLGHSPSSRTGASRTSTATRALQQRHSPCLTQSRRTELSEVPFRECAFIEPLATSTCIIDVERAILWGRANTHTGAHPFLRKSRQVSVAAERFSNTSRY